MKSFFSGLVVLLSVLCVAVPAHAGIGIDVPEPATGLLVALGIGAVALIRRKNSKTPPVQ